MRFVFKCLAVKHAGGRVTVEAARRVRVYAGYAQDRSSRDADPANRVLIGGYASNIVSFDISASDSLYDRPDGSYHARYVSVGRQLGRRAYFSVDYSTSLSVVRFSRSDGIVVETRPHMTRVSATATGNLGRSVSLLGTVERTRDDGATELRLLTGLAYRLR